MRIRYGSADALDLSDKIGHSLLNQAVFTSSLLAKEKGSFPKYYENALFKSPFFIQNIDPQVKNTVKKFGLRNSQLLTIAPTGSLSTMLGITGGIEPIYNTKYWRKTESLHGKDKYYEVLTPIVEKVMAIENCTENNLPDYIVTAMTLAPLERVAMQGIWQQYIDASISSTVNLPESATVEDISNIYMEAWKQGLKGVTVFRDKCARTGILTNVDDDGCMEDKFNPDLDKTTDAYENDKFIICQNCGAKIQVVAGGCPICMVCGYSPCS